MKIKSAEFIKSAFEEAHWTKDGKPEISFLGRSNVGKSSLINSLLQRKNLARTSNTPGRTQSINFFLINESFYFVDLPGYGYAKVPKAIRASWGQMAENYLAKRRELVLSIQLDDSRHEPTNLDIQLNEWLLEYQKPHLVIATKIDKLSAKEYQQNLDNLRRILAKSPILSYSSVTGKGRDELWQAIAEAIKVKKNDLRS